MNLFGDFISPRHGIVVLPGVLFVLWRMRRTEISQVRKSDMLG
jgi:hypothetical protein